MEEGRTDRFHEEGIVIEIVLHEEQSSGALLARTLHHHIERPVFVHIHEHRAPGIRDGRKWLDALAHFAPPAPRTRRRTSRHAACAGGGEQKAHAALGYEEQVGKAVQIGVARARQDGLRGRERRVEYLELRAVL